MVDSPQIASLWLALESPDAEERRQAVSHLGELTIGEALPLLVRALADEDWRVRKEATIAVRPYTLVPELAAAMIEILATSEDVGQRNAAVDVLACAGPVATEALADALPRLDADARKLAVEALGHGRDPLALDLLEHVLAHDTDANVRQAAVESVARLGVLARDRVADVLMGSIDDTDSLVQLTAVSGLCALEVVIPWARLSPLLQQPTLRPVAVAAAALSDDPAAVRALVEALEQAQGEAFARAMSALARLAEGPLEAQVQRALRAPTCKLGERMTTLVLDRALPLERRATALALAAAALAPGVAVAAFACLSDDSLADAARRALLVVGASAVPDLVAHLSDGASHARAELIDVLAEIADQAPDVQRDPALHSALRAALHDPDPRVAVSALAAFARVGTGDDLGAVAALCLAEGRAVAQAAGGTLAELARRHPEAARVHIATLAKEEAFLPAVIELGALATEGLHDASASVFLAHVAAIGDTAARSAAVLAAAEIDDPLTLEVLRIALTDEEHFVQLAAARALGRRAASGSELSLLELLDPVERTGATDLLAAAVRSIGERMSASQPERRSVPFPSADLLTTLADYAHHAASPVALAAVDSLGHAQAFGANATHALTMALEHPEASVAKAAALKLGASPLGLVALANALAHPIPAVRARVAAMILDTDLPGAREHLIHRAAIEDDRDVREALEWALDETTHGADAGPLSRRESASRPPGGNRL